MTMIVQFLVFTCACALGAAEEVPTYGEIRDNIKQARKLLEDNVLSMEGNIPLINDPRRHYTEIVNVVYSQAVSLIACIPPIPEYFENYQNVLNDSAPKGLANPQFVIDYVKLTIDKIHSHIDEVLQLIDAVSLKTTNEKELDEAVQEEINNDINKYGNATPVYLATGIAATQLNHAHADYFAASSESLSAHNFVITGAEKLEKLVMAVKNLVQLLIVSC